MKEASFCIAEEDSQNTLSLEDSSKPVITISLAPEPKSKAGVDGSNVTFSKLSDLTKNHIVDFNSQTDAL